MCVCVCVYICYIATTNTAGAVTFSSLLCVVLLTLWALMLTVMQTLFSVCFLLVEFRPDITAVVDWA